MQQVEATSTPAVKIPPQNLPVLQTWYNKIAEMYQTNVRVHAAMNVPADILAKSLDKLNDLFRQGQQAFDAHDVAQLENVYNQLRHFNEPAEVQAYHGQQFQQQVNQLHNQRQTGNR